jgi:replicative DNA helicase
LKPAQLFVLAARPSRGKSSLALNIADHVAIVLEKPVLYFSLEMSKRELLARASGSRARVNIKRAEEGVLTEKEVRALTVAQSALASAPIHIIDKGGMSIAQLAGLARVIVQREGGKLIQ